MYTVQEESTQRSSTLKASKKKGWEILYTPAEGSDEQNTSVFVPYEDFGDKLTVIDGCAKDLEIKTDITQTVKKGESIEGNLQLKYMGDTPVALDVADIDEISFFYDKAGYIEAKWDATQQKLKVKGLKSGTVNLTIKVAMKHGSINLVNVSDKIEFTVSDTEPVIEGNLIKLTAAAGGDTIILAKPIDPNDLCDTDTDGVINVHINETETTSVNLNEIESVKLIECDSTITTLGSEFLSGADHMTEADLSGLSNITSIADNFCNACSAMYEIDINFMSAISSIGNNFVNECNYLYILDLPIVDPSNIPTLGSWGTNIATTNRSNTILLECGQLDITAAYKANQKWHNTVGHISSSIQIVGWTPITPTGNNYLELTNGTILKLADTLNLECLCNQGGGTLQVETQPYGREYTSVQVGQIKKIVIKTIEENEHSQHIRPGFLDGAYNLETLELNDCTEITSSHIITTILDSFLGNCIRLTTIDLSSLTNLTSVGERFLDSTQNVANIKMPNVNPNNIPTLQSWGNNIGPVDSNPVNLICKTNQLMNAYMSSTWAQVEGHFESGATWVVG